MDKLIITAALVGAEVTRQEQPNLPLTPAEIADAAFDCWQAGASMVHLHARNLDGSSTQNAAVFADIISLIRRRCDIIIQVSTGGAVGMTAEERLAPVTLKPEMATLTTGTVNFGEDIFVNSLADIEQFAQTIKQYGVKPEVEVFDSGMIATALRLVRKGLLTPPLHFDFVLGVPGGAPATLKTLLHLTETIPSGSTWSVAGIGASELPLAVQAILQGGHVRVGFEDNIFYTKGVLAKSNAQLVERVVRISREIGRELASPAEARQILGLPCIKA
jgi:3-keto-5-aminohexanoate cleavage enzyme